jgi:hypothetical protein
MEKISWTDHVKNLEVLVKEETGILRTVKRKRPDCIDHIFSSDANSVCQHFSTECLLKTLLKGRQKGR